MLGADWTDAHTTNAIVDVHADDPEFGYRFIADELEAIGHRSCERRVWRLCSQQRAWSSTTKKGRKAAGKTPGPAVHDDLVQRVFSAPAPDMVWLTDITEHPTMEGKLLRPPSHRITEMEFYGTSALIATAFPAATALAW